MQISRRTSAEGEESGIETQSSTGEHGWKEWGHRPPVRLPKPLTEQDLQRLSGLKPEIWSRLEQIRVDIVQSLQRPHLVLGNVLEELDDILVPAHLEELDLAHCSDRKLQDEIVRINHSGRVLELHLHHPFHPPS